MEYQRELGRKPQATGGDLAEAVRRYNGQGPAARRYREKVMGMHDWLAADRSQGAVERETAESVA